MSALRLACLSCALLVSAAAAGSPAGAAKQRIVFLGGPPAAFELFIADASGQHEHPLLPAGPAGYNPSFTADGKWLAFTSERGGSPDIYRVHPDGSGLEQLTDAPGFDDQGALSPDGRTLAFVSTRDTGNANVWLLDIARHRYFNLTHDSHGNFRPSWSPDGRWLAFSSDRDGPHGRSGADRAPPAGSGCCGWELLQFTALYIIHPDGSGLRRLTPVGQVAGSPRWAPDGRHIVYYFDARTLTQYQSKAAGASQIRTIDIDTGTTADLTSGAQNKGAPAYLAATRIGYLIAQGAQAILADTAGWRTTARDLAAPAWSPDGRVVVYAKRSAAPATPPNPIVKFAAADPQYELYRTDSALAYSPDGRQVLFSGSFIGRKALMVMNADGTHHRVLFDATAHDAGVVSPTWSPDGRYIAFTLGRFGLRNPNTPARIALIRSDGSQLRILTQGPDNCGYPSFAPDGRRLVYRVLGAEQGLRILSLADGKSSVLTRSQDNFPAWSPVGDRIVFTGLRTGDFEIYTIRPDGTGLRQLTRDHGNDAHAIWSPDGRSILFTSARTGWKDETRFGGGGQSNGEIVVMRADGSHLRQLTDDQWEEAAATWLRPLGTLPITVRAPRAGGYRSDPSP